MYEAEDPVTVILEELKNILIYLIIIVTEVRGCFNVHACYTASDRKFKIASSTESDRSRLLPLNLEMLLFLKCNILASAFDCQTLIALQSCRNMEGYFFLQTTRLLSIYTSIAVT